MATALSIKNLLLIMIVGFGCCFASFSYLPIFADFDFPFFGLLKSGPDSMRKSSRDKFRYARSENLIDWA